MAHLIVKTYLLFVRAPGSAHSVVQHSCADVKYNEISFWRARRFTELLDNGCFSKRQLIPHNLKTESSTSFGENYNVVDNSATAHALGKVEKDVAFVFPFSIFFQCPPRAHSNPNVACSPSRFFGRLSSEVTGFASHHAAGRYADALARFWSNCAALLLVALSLTVWFHLCSSRPKSVIPHVGEVKKVTASNML